MLASPSERALFQPDSALLGSARLLTALVEDYLCDVMFKSRDGQQHKGHRIIISSASEALRALLGSTFAESELIKKGEPVHWSAPAELGDGDSPTAG